MKCIVQRGMTLIEILVVILIISIVSSVALLTLSHNKNKALENVAQEITQMLTLAEEEALLKPGVFSVSVKDHVLQFMKYQSSTSDKPKWVPLQDALFSTRVVPDDVMISLKVQNDTDEGRVVISSNGDLTPFVMKIGEKGKKPRYEITGDADGNIASKKLL